MPGFPIRTSSDQRSVGNSPRHNAASHVLHRLSMPRHPPCALNEQTQKLVRATHTKSHKKNRKKHTPTTPTTTQGQQVPINEMLASTIQFSHNTPHHQATTPQPPQRRITQEQQPTARSTGTHTRVVPDTRQHANAPFNYLSPPPPGQTHHTRKEPFVQLPLPIKPCGRCTLGNLNHTPHQPGNYPTHGEKLLSQKSP